MIRAAAAAIALLAWAGLAIQAAATFELTGSLLVTLGVLLRYFTVLTNVLVAVVMSAITLGLRPSRFLLGGVTLSILLVGVIYMTLLRGMVELSGGALLADTLLHKVTPVLVPLYWLALIPKGTLRWRDPLWWSLYALAYFVYALARGAIEGRYAYPFIDLGSLGVMQTGFNAAAIWAGFVLAGLVLVGLDRSLGTGKSRASLG